MSSLLKNSEDINNRLSINLKGVGYDKNLFSLKLGITFRPSEIGASFGLAQLKKIKTFLKLRNRNFNLHKNFLIGSIIYSLFQNS